MFWKAKSRLEDIEDFDLEHCSLCGAAGEAPSLPKFKWSGGKLSYIYPSALARPCLPFTHHAGGGGGGGLSIITTLL
jgi:hypothetical protein